MPTSTPTFGNITVTEIAEMIENTSSSLHLRFNALVDDVSDLLLQHTEKQSHKLEPKSVKVRTIDSVTGQLELRANVEFVRKLSPGIVAVLPHTKQLGVRSGIDDGEASFFAMSPSEYLLAIGLTDTSGAYERLIETIDALEALRDN